MKERIQLAMKSIMGDFFLPKLFIALPIILLLIMPFAAQQDFRQMGVVVVDRDHSSSSARLIQKVDASRTFRVVEVLPNEIDAQPLLDYGKADFMLDIPQDFERDLFSAMTSANISGNSVNMMKGGLGSGYLTNIVMEFASEIRMENISRSSVPVRPVTFNIPTRYMYNQRADLKLFMLPVLLVILMTLLAGILPSLFGGAMITEEVFAIDGIGRLAYKALQNGDVPFIMGYNMFLAILTVIGTLLSDLMYAVVDPRVKLSK